MNKALLASALLAAAPLAAQADDGWSGTGEVGFAAARGNARSENLNVKLQFKKENDVWKNNFYLNALRSKGEIKTTTIQDGVPATTSSFELTANRYEAGASAGYKLDERSYVVGALRYEDDDFSPFDYQSVVSIGYGYTAIKNPRTELSFEIGPGYKRYRPVEFVETTGEPPVSVLVHPDSRSEAVGRGLMTFKHKLTDNTRFENTLLTESGSSNTFLQNDAGIAVAMNKSFALKLGYQLRHNSDAGPGLKKTDQLITTNLVYNF
ncbi:MAG TPA: DUF481 domain-containing protein [Rhodanobacteraceae bacterium]|nr:DUF481 domain-containing protein [Rhodanobacteraceae bacterium]